MISTSNPPLKPETVSLIVAEYNALREEINFEIIELLGKENIELAAASTDIVVKQKEQNHD